MTLAPTRKIVITGDDKSTEIHVLGTGGGLRRDMISIVRGTILRNLSPVDQSIAVESLHMLVLQPEVEWAPLEIGVSIAWPASSVGDWLADIFDSIVWLRASDPASGRFVAVGIW